MLNDPAIRTAFHLKQLRKAHRNADTLVVDELGIDHGRQRADIAVINGRMIGYEIKSDQDTLDRLNKQIAGYNRVFDYAVLVATTRHIQQAESIVPSWWGIINVSEGTHGVIRFQSRRKGTMNPKVNAIALARLLWRDEVITVLRDLGVPSNQLRKERAILYQSLVRRLTVVQLAKLVRNRLKEREEWRDLSRPSLYGGSEEKCGKGLFLH
jgi:hypothetical protein